MVAYPQKIRQKAIELHKSKKTITHISETLKVSYRTIQSWIKNYKKEGEKGLVPKYKNCGHSTLYSDELIEKAISYKTIHPDWGAPFILLKLEDEYGKAKLPSARRLQQIFVKRKVQKQKDRLPRGDGKWAKNVFDRVQVDAKERLKTKDGKDCCYLNFTDEYTGSVLDAFIFPLCSY